MKYILFFFIVILSGLYSQTDTLYLRLPEYIYTTTTSEYSIYYNNTFLSQYPDQYSFVVNCPVGYYDGKRYNLDSLEAGIYNFELEIRDSVGTLLETDESTIISTENSINYNDTLKILFVGNSLTLGGFYPRYVKEFLDESSTFPTKLLGTIFYTVQDSIDGIFHEGRSGWTWGRYCYDPLSPFVSGDPQIVDIQKYLDESLNGEIPDIVTFLLGINDISGLPDESEIENIDANMDFIFDNGNMDTLIDEFEKALPNTQIGISLIPVANERPEIWYIAYGDSLRGWIHKKYQHRLVQRYIDYYNDHSKTNLSMIPIYPNIDTFWGYNENSTVHPNYYGYSQVANSFYGWIKYLILQKMTEPKNLELNLNENSVTLNWDSSPDVFLYHIYRSLVPYSGFEHIGSSSDANFTDDNLNGSTKYFYRVTSEISFK